jgi:transposase-like protein
MARKRRNYTDEFRASCVLMLEAAGYPDRKGALAHVSKEVNVPSMTLRRWFTGQQNPPPNQLVSKNRIPLADKLESVAHQYIDHASNPDVVDEMDGKGAMTAAAIAIDKMRLLRGLPTEIVQIMPEVLEAIDILGLTPAAVFERLIRRAKKVKEQQGQPIDSS